MYQPGAKYIHMTNVYTTEEVMAMKARSIAKNHNPPTSTTVGSTMAHELGHALENLMADQYAKLKNDRWDMVWRGERVPKTIYNRVLDRMSDGTYQSLPSIRAKFNYQESVHKYLGDYARTNHHELMAEAIMDGLANTDKNSFGAIFVDETKKYIKELGL